jgi:hypothetical protein
LPGYRIALNSFVPLLSARYLPLSSTGEDLKHPTRRHSNPMASSFFISVLLAFGFRREEHVLAKELVGADALEPYSVHTGQDFVVHIFRNVCFSIV